MKNIEKYRDVVLENLNNCYLESRLRMLYGKEVVNCSEIHCGKCKERFLKWLLEEYKEQEVLDDVEREYLSAVIKPFRKKVMYISKQKNFNTRMEYLRIVLFDEDCMYLPHFEENTMYKGMELCKCYKPEELGL